MSIFRKLTNFHSKSTVSLLKGFKEFENNLLEIGSIEKVKTILNISSSSQQISNYLGSSNEDSLFTNLGKLKVVPILKSYLIVQIPQIL